jgi:hypothetical protein
MNKIIFDMKLSVLISYMHPAEKSGVSNGTTESRGIHSPQHCNLRDHRKLLREQNLGLAKFALAQHSNWLI